MEEDLKALAAALLDELTSLRQDLEQLPEQLHLSTTSPLCYMLDPERSRLDRLLQRCARKAQGEIVDEEIKAVLDEYARLDEILCAHRELHHDIDPDGSITARFSERVSTIRKHFTQLCKL